MPDVIDRVFDLSVDSSSYKCSKDDYLHESTIKKNICLHATAGNSLCGAVETLSKLDHIAVHFIVDKNGKVYQFFPLKYWAFHLGIENSGGKYDKGTIGIEIVNVGPLVKRDQNLCYWPNRFNAKYCTVDDFNWFTKLQSPWREYSYYANFSKPQYESVSMLCAYLCAITKIHPAVLSDVNEFHLDDIDEFNGIYTHTSVRREKYDVGPAWSWQYFNRRLDSYVKQLSCMTPFPSGIVVT